ncbi:MAG: DUF2141 domain-containing protein [Pseudomonadota bacterium]
MKPVLLLAAALLALPALATDHGERTPSGALVFDFEALPDSRRPVLAALFADREALRDRVPLRQVRLEPDSGTARWSIEDLPPGRYAVLAFQDGNGNDCLDRRRNGRPLEPYATSGERGRGAPRFDRVSVDYAGATVRFTIDRWEVPQARAGAGVGT